MGAVFAQQKKCPLNAVVRAAGFFAVGEKEGKRDTRWMAVGEQHEPEPDSLNASRAAGFFAVGEKEGKRDTLYV